MIAHHPDTRLLNEFSAGSLALAQAACVSLHLRFCAACRYDHQRLQRLGAALFEALAPQQVDDSLLRGVMNRIDEQPAPLSFSQNRCETTGFPALVQRLMEGDCGEIDWRRINRDLRISRLRTGDLAHEFALYHIRAGGRIPRHSHRGTELTLVLEGSFSDEAGHYQQGDFILRDSAQVHTPTAGRDRDCVCVGVLDAPIHFRAWNYRLLNPLMKIQPR
jgi:putative transcriptional regulator